jgi:hypothetical protein
MSTRARSARTGKWLYIKSLKGLWGVGARALVKVVLFGEEKGLGVLARRMRGCVAWRRNTACARAHFEELRELGELHLARGALRVCDMRALSY